MGITERNALIVIAGAVVLLLYLGLMVLVCYLFPGFRNVLIGFGTSPRATGFMRAIFFQGAPTLITLAIAFVADWHDPRLVGLQGVLNLLLRQAEAEMDKQIKKYQNQGDAGKT